MIVTCRHEPPHAHEYPDDWEFGGANGTDPAADPRWRGSTYTYWSDKFELLELTSAPRCDDQAIDYFSMVAKHFKNSNPHFIQAKRPDGTVETLPFRYNRETDEVYDAL
jgi:hypothetical protein